MWNCVRMKKPCTPRRYVRRNGTDVDDVYSIYGERGGKRELILPSPLGRVASRGERRRKKHTQICAMTGEGVNRKARVKAKRQSQPHFSKPSQLRWDKRRKPFLFYVRFPQRFCVSRSVSSYSPVSTPVFGQGSLTLGSTSFVSWSVSCLARAAS